MNKQEFVDALMAKNNDIPSKAAGKRIVDDVLNLIIDTVVAKDEVSFVGFGTFKAQDKAARMGQNPQTGKPIKIAATTVPKFKAGAPFKAAVAPKKKGKK